MFDRIKDATRQAKIDRSIRAILSEIGIEQGADVNVRLFNDQTRATVLLPAESDFTGDAAKALERRLSSIDGLDAVTVVTTHHKGAQQAPDTSSAPDEDRVARAHANPLGVPGAAPVTDADRDMSSRARPVRQRPAGPARVLAVASGKGGVGKSTVAAGLALSLAKAGARVGLLDLDIFGPSLPVMFDLDGIEPRVEDGKIIPLSARGLSLMSIGFLVGEDQALAWRGPMVMGAAKQLLDDVRWGPLDWLIIDTPPGTGDAHITLMQRTRIDGAIIVTTPSPLALADVRRGTALFRRMEVPILGLVENMAALPDGQEVFGPGLDDNALKQLDLPRLARLPIDPAFAIHQAGGPMDALSEALSPLSEDVTNRLPPLDRAASPA